MANLLALLATGIPAIISALLAFFARKMATAAGSIIAFIALTVTFIACEKGTYDALMSSLLIPAWFTNSLGMFIPGNFAFCLSSYVSSRICAAAYKMSREKLKFINNAS